MELINWATSKAYPVTGPDTHDVHATGLAGGGGQHAMVMLHLKAGSRAGETKTENPQCIVIVQGTAWLATSTERFKVPAGHGILAEAGERYTLGSIDGALAVVLESQVLASHVNCRMTEQETQALRQ